MELSSNEATEAKEKLNQFFFEHFKKAIIRQIEVSNDKVILGSFPYWKDEANFSSQVCDDFQLKIQDIKSQEGEQIKGEVCFTTNFYNSVFEDFGIPLVFNFSATTGEEEDFIAIEDESDLKKIQKFSIAFFNFYDQAQVNKANDLMENHFYQLLFLSRLKS